MIVPVLATIGGVTLVLMLAIMAMGTFDNNCASLSVGDAQLCTNVLAWGLGIIQIIGILILIFVAVGLVMATSLMKSSR